MKPKRAEPPDPDRRLFLVNDWYGHGFIAGITGVRLDTEARDRWMAAEPMLYREYLRGLRHGQATQRTPCK